MTVGNVAAGTTYVIKKNDTLTLIAKEHGVTVSDLARRNDLSLRETIYPGQRLVIPGQDTALSPSVRAAIKNARVRRGRWKYIVIHHSATRSGTVKGMDAYHRQTRHMENGLAYHFVIGNGRGIRDGEVAVGRRWTGQLDGGHLASLSLNRVSIGICLVGHFDQTRPTLKQLESLKALIEALRKRCNLKASAVKTHQQINPVYTRCPGRYLDLNRLLERRD